MKHDSKYCRSHCPINFALETFGDKWTLLVIRDLLFKGKRYYSDFLESGEGISTNILADRLKALETSGLIQKRVDPNKRSKMIYSLTEKGLGLLPVMLEITAWSKQYDSLSNAPDEFMQAFKQDKDALAAQILAEYE